MSLDIPSSLADCLFGNTNKTETCWIWKGSKTKQGYGRLRFMVKTFMAHRVSYELTHGRIPDNLWVLHKCDTPSCIRPDHLFLGTTLDNQTDKHNKGRTASDYQNGRAKLTNLHVNLIRGLYASKTFNQVELAAKFGITQGHVSAIIRKANRKNSLTSQ